MKAEKGTDILIEESALPLDDVLKMLAPRGGVMFAGDAAGRFEARIREASGGFTIARKQFLLQRASSVCMCAYGGKARKTAHDGLLPHYLRVSQAERLKNDANGK